jgi:hypothetical protein
MRASRANVAGLQETATTLGTFGPSRRRIEDHRAETIQFGGGERVGEEVAPDGADRLQSAGVAARLVESGQQRRLAVHRRDRSPSCEAEAECPDAREEVGHGRGIADVRSNRGGHRRLRRGYRLNKAAGRRQEGVAVNGYLRRAVEEDRGRLGGEPRNSGIRSQSAELRELSAVKFPAARDGDV